MYQFFYDISTRAGSYLDTIQARDQQHAAIEYATHLYGTCAVARHDDSNLYVATIGNIKQPPFSVRINDSFINKDDSAPTADSHVLRRVWESLESVIYECSSQDECEYELRRLDQDNWMVKTIHTMCDEYAVMSPIEAIKLVRTTESHSDED